MRLTRERPTEIRRATAKEYARWVASHEWDHFTGLTYDRAVSRETAIAGFRRWIRWLEQRAERRVCWCYALERHLSGQFHLHCLLYTSGALSCRAAQEAWDNGYSHLAAFRSELGGPEYVLKTVGTPDAEYDFSKHFPPLRVPSAA